MSEADPAHALAQLADDYWEGTLRRNPTLATFFGDYRYNDRLPDISPRGRMEEEAELDALRLRLDELAVDQMDGPQVWLPELVNWHPTDTPEHVRQLIARYRAFGELMSEYLGNLEDGIRDHRTAPTIAVERVIAHLRALLATPPDDSPMSAPAANQPPQLADELRRSVVEIVYPAFQRMLDFLAEYLVRHARKDPG